MKNFPKIFASLALAAVCALSAAACATKSNLKQEGWEEIIDSSRQLGKYQIMLTTIATDADLISETYSADYAAQTLKYNKVGNEAGTIEDKEIKIDSEGRVILREWKYDNEAMMSDWVTTDVTDTDAEEEAERTHAYNDFGAEYDLRNRLFGVVYYPAGAEDYVELKELYGYLKYSSGEWVADMDFVIGQTRYSGSVSVWMPDTIESARNTLSSVGYLFKVTLATAVEGVAHEWIYTLFVG